jgi:hypothetical protein
MSYGRRLDLPDIVVFRRRLVQALEYALDEDQQLARVEGLGEV